MPAKRNDLKAEIKQYNTKLFGAEFFLENVRFDCTCAGGFYNSDQQ